MTDAAELIRETLELMRNRPAPQYGARSPEIDFKIDGEWAVLKVRLPVPPASRSAAAAKVERRFAELAAERQRKFTESPTFQRYARLSRQQDGLYARLGDAERRLAEAEEAAKDSVVTCQNANELLHSAATAAAEVQLVRKLLADLKSPLAGAEKRARDEWRYELVRTTIAMSNEMDVDFKAAHHAAVQAVARAVEAADGILNEADLLARARWRDHEKSLRLDDLRYAPQQFQLPDPTEA